MSLIELQSYSLFGLAGLLLLLIIWMLRRYQRSLSVIYYLFFLFGLVLILIIQGSVYISQEPNNLLWLSRLGYIAGTITFSMLLMFSWYWPIPSGKFPSKPILYWIVPLAFFIPYILFNPSFLVSVQAVPNGTKEISGPAFFVFPVFVLFYMVLVIRNLIEKYRSLSGDQLREMRVFVWALVIASLSGLIFDVLLPAFGKARIPIGIYSASILFSISAYIVNKK